MFPSFGPPLNNSRREHNRCHAQGVKNSVRLIAGWRSAGRSQNLYQTQTPCGSPRRKLPDWLLNAYVTYTRRPFSVTLQGRFIDSGVVDATRIDPSNAGYSPTLVNSTNDNHVASAFYANLFGSFDIPVFREQTVQVFAAINNLFDKVPPFAPEGQYPTNPTYFDQIGRTYRVGARVAF